MIKIVHLYYDLLNLYGDSGNVKALEYHLKSSGIQVETVRHSLGETIDLSECDIVYIGSGTEHSLMLALDDIMQYRDEISGFKERGGILLSTGNSIELFGKSIKNGKNEKQALGISGYSAEYGKRVVKDVCVKTGLVENEIIGFENHSGRLDTDKDIITEDNFIMTYIIGPVLVRNPQFNDMIIKRILEKYPDESGKYSPDHKLEQKAYDVFRNSMK